MLHSLRIKNLAIVENIHVEFGPGLSVITGETGAGKSILVGALGLVLGERADKTMIRAGEMQCGVEAVFQLADTGPIDAVLDDLGITPCADGELIVRRIVAAAGSGRSFINDDAATVQALRRVGKHLVDMHGPHEHQSLLSHDFQLDLLDSFGRLAGTRDTYAVHHRTCLDLEQRLAALDGDDGQVSQQIDLLTYQVKEIEEADLTDADEEDLEKEHALAANAQRVLELAGGIENALTGDEGSAFNALAFARRAFDELAGITDEAGAWRDEVDVLNVHVQELADSLSRYVAGIDADPGRLQYLEDRMALVQRLKRKYGGSVMDILAFLASATAQLEDLGSRGERVTQLTRELADAGKTRAAAGSKLGKARRKAAGKLAEAITAELQALGFEHGRFDVELEETEPGPAGMDDIEFGFAPNAGEPMRPLRAIASSGEISRVMLASKAVLAGHDRIPVLCFDEIDANLGGEMGNAVGTKLGTVAEKHQVLCITHLPQVAVHGARHFVVSKQVADGRTTTTIRQAEGAPRTEEVARMLGGRDLTDVTLEHARQMLERK